MTWFFALGAILTLTLAVLLWRLSAPLAALTGLALAYDNAVIALGHTIGPGEALQTLNAGRFWAHALVTPMMIWAGLKLIGYPWRWPFAAVTTVLIGLGIYTDTVQLDLVAREESGVLRYANAAAQGPPIPAVVTIVILAGIGVVLWRRAKVPWLLAGALAMFVAAALGTKLLWLQNLGELTLLASFLLSERTQRGTQKQLRLRQSGDDNIVAIVP